MKIVHVTSVHDRYDNRIFYKQCIDLSKKFPNFHLFVADGLKNETLRGIVITDSKIFKSKSRILRILIESPVVLYKAFKANPGLIHIHDPELLLYAPFLRYFFSKQKIIYDMHENLSASVLTKSYLPKMTRKFISKMIFFIEKSLLKNISIVYAEKSYSKYYKTKMSSACVMNFPKDIWFNKETVSTEKKIKKIGYIGSCTLRRGLMNLLSAVDTINREGYNIHVELIGNIRDNINHSQIFNSLVADSKLKVHGFVPNEKAIQIVKNWDIGFAVLENDPNYVESYPTKLFEYFALSIPVVTSNPDLYKDLVDEFNGGKCVNPGNQEELIEAITDILIRPEEYIPKYPQGKYRWENELKKLVDLYEEILC